MMKRLLSVFHFLESLKHFSHIRIKRATPEIPNIGIIHTPGKHIFIPAPAHLLKIQASTSKFRFSKWKLDFRFPESVASL